MISRTWHGIVPITMKENFKNYLDITGVKDTISISGNKGAFVKVVDQGEYAHFFLCTLWDRMESVILYAGENPEIAVTYPEDEKYGLISDPIVIHQEVKSGRSPFLKENLKLFVDKLTEERAKQVCSWRYEGEYSVYDFSWEQAAEQGWSIALAEKRESDFRAVTDEQGLLAGFFRMTKDEQGKIEIGLGLRPDLCGQGIGKDFVRLITKYTLDQHPNCRIYMEVRAFNKRAVRCYEACGYKTILQHRKETPSGSNDYFLMEYQNT